MSNTQAGSQNKTFKDLLLSDIKKTCSNYSNMYSRLKTRHTATSFFVVYYSIFSIVCGLIPKYYALKSIIRSLLDFSSIIISIVILVASLMISIANYTYRIQNTITAIDSLKKMKKTIEGKQKDIEYDEYNSLVNEYHDIIDYLELRTDVDFYKTCKQLNEVTNYFSRCQVLIMNIQIIVEYLLYTILFIAPIYITIVLISNIII